MRVSVSLHIYGACVLSDACFVGLWRTCSPSRLDKQTFDNGNWRTQRILLDGHRPPRVGQAQGEQLSKALGHAGASPPAGSVGKPGERNIFSTSGQGFCVLVS